MIKMLDFWAGWCGPCRLMKPLIKDLAETYNIEMIDVDENSDKAQQYSINSIPTFIFLKDGEEVERIVGAVSRERLINTFEKHQ